MSLPFQPDTLTRLRAPLVQGYANNYEADWGNPDRLVLKGSAQAQSSSETTQANDQVVTTYRVFLDGAPDVVATDRMEFDGETYEITGQPLKQPSPFGGINHTELIMTLVKG